MDSGNSGSMQSSSGGDEEYDSRSASISAFMNSSGGHAGAVSNQQQLPLLPSLHPSASSLDPSLTNYLDPLFRSPPPQNANPLSNLDMVWTRGIRSEPNCTDTGALLGSSSSSSRQLILGSQDSGRTPLPNPSSMPLSQATEKGATVPVTSDHQPHNTARNSKKRSRASRRAPTTVLTTDTSNFRAMVQEFTGIPAPPFSSSPFSRSRLDLFRSPTTMRSGHLEPTAPSPSHYLLRPFAQKVQPPPFLSPTSFSSSNMADGIASTSSNIIGGNNNTTCSVTSNNSPTNFASTSSYQLLSDQLGLHKQTQNLLNMQNPIVTFQSLLGSSPPSNYPLANVPISNAKSQGSVGVLWTTDPQLRMGLLEEHEMNHGHVGAAVGSPPCLVTSDGMPVRTNNTASRWSDGVGLQDGSTQVPSRFFNANYVIGAQQVLNGCSSSDFHSEKASDQNVTSRGEGMVDSWICPSD